MTRRQIRQLLDERFGRLASVERERSVPLSRAPKVCGVPVCKPAGGHRPKEEV